MSAHTISNPVPTPEEMAAILDISPERATAVREIMSPIFVERRQQGDYIVRRAYSNRATAVFPTQAEAIKKAKELNPDRQAFVERVRSTGSASPDKWRRV
jgi:hypothetical protein